MNYIVIGGRNIPAGFPLDHLFDADADLVNRSCNLGKSIRGYFTIERIPEPEMIYEPDFHHV